MGTITSGVGLVSGLNSKDIIDQLMSIEGRRKDLVQARIDAIDTQKTAYLDVSTRLTSLRLSAQSFSKPSFFTAATATSSNEDVITATAAKGAAVGSYQFQVARLVQSQQLVSRGMSNPDKAAVGAGTLTLEMGGGEVTQQNLLSDLRGGQGISGGKIRITDMTGKNAVVDLSDAVTLDDVIKKINTAVDVNVEAKVVGDRLTLTDRSNGFDSDLVVQDIGTTTTAADLGLAGSNILGQISGSVINYVGRDTKLASLNDGNGVSNRSGNDFKITFADGTSADVDLGSAVTMGDALDAINTAAGTKGVATLAPGGKGLTLTDNTTGGGTLTVAAIDGSTAFKDLGLDAAVNGKQIDGSALQSKLGTVLLKTLNGGAGIKLGTISVTNRQGAATSIDLSQAQTLQTAIESINGANAGIKAAVNASGNGLALTDTTGGTGNLVIGDVSGTGAAQLGLAGTFTAAQATVRGANLQRKWVSENTALASYNGGKGVAVGEMKISAGNGESRVIKIDPATDLRMGDVIKKINTAFNGKVVASVNTTGDGLLLTDATGGAGTLKVDEVNSTTAADLGLDAKATGTTLDGTREKKITIDADDTLADVQTKINDLSHGLGASIINDGSGSAPFRLSLNARNSGMAGRMVFDAGATSLSTRTLVEAQDAAVFVGTAGGAQPLLITASRNQISGVIKGVNIDLHGVSSAPVTVNVTRDIGNVGETMQSFVDSFNELIGKVDEYTKFDSATMERGILLGDPSITQVENELYGMLSVVVPQAGKFRILADVGLRVGEGGKLEFDQEKFNSAYAEDPESVEELFTNAGSAIASSTKTSLLNRGSGVQTAGDGKKDFKATLRDGSTVEVGIGEVANLGQIISAINAASPAKLRAEITEDGRVNLTDLTAGVKTFALEQINASQFIYDLGLTATQKDGIIVGRQLKVENSLEAVTGGIGVTMQQKLNKLIDPVNGLITRQSKTLTARTDQYKDRIEDLGKLLDAKRFRLEKQFANLESSLSQLQNQQSSLGSIQSLNNNNNNR